MRRARLTAAMARVEYGCAFSMSVHLKTTDGYKTFDWYTEICRRSLMSYLWARRMR